MYMYGNIFHLGKIGYKTKYGMNSKPISLSLRSVLLCIFDCWVCDAFFVSLTCVVNCCEFVFPEV